MRRKLAVLAVFAVLALGPLLPPSGGSARVFDPTMYTVVTLFSDNSTMSSKNFYGPGMDSSTFIRIPAGAAVKSASIDLLGSLLDLRGSFTHDSNADFANGSFTNITLSNGSLVLRPFLNQTVYDTGLSPVAMAAGDINHDGRTDLVTANSQAASIGVFLQNASLGKMEAQSTYSVGQGPQGVAIGDLNGDGRLDVAVACSGLGTLEVLLQASDGSLQGALSYSSGNGARAVAIADFNFDTLNDIVVVNSVDRTLSLFIQDRYHDLSLAGKFPTGNNPVSVAAGDINADNRAEAVVANRDDSTLTVFTQNATTWLKRSAAYDVGRNPACVVIADLDRDGRKDVVVAEQGNATVGVLRQGVDGNLTHVLSYPVPNAPAWAAAGDLDYDGRPDLALACPANRTAALLFQAQDGSFLPAEEYSVGRSPESVVIADLNLDGKRDFAVANRLDNNIGVALLRTTRPGALNQMAAHNTGSSPVGMATGDLNRDGLDDLAVANTLTGGAGCSVLLQTRAGQMAAQVQYTTGNPSVPLQAVAVADFNRDGRQDMVFSNRVNAGATVFLQTVLGDFTGTPATYYTGLPDSGGYLVAAGDLNSDGWPDIALTNIYAVSTDPNTISVFLNDAINGSFFPPLNYTCEGSRGAAIGDVNSDGRNDLVGVAQTTNEIIVYYQDQFGSLTTPGTRLAADTAPHGVRIGDLNADGRNDIAVTAWTANMVDVYLQTASGTLANRATYPVSSTTSAVDVEILDYDGDGLNDLAISHYLGANTISLMNQTRQGTFSGFSTINAGVTPTFLGTGDYNSDGKADLAVTNRGGNSAGIFTQAFSFDMNGTYSSRFMALPYEVHEATPDWNLSVTGTGQNLTLDISNDNGRSWVRAGRNQSVSFPLTGRTLGYRLRMTSGAINQTPVLQNLTVHYTMRSYPIDPSLDVGLRGTPIWNWTGPFGMSGQPSTVDFTERLNATLQDGTPDAGGFITVPFGVASGSLGRLRLQNLLVAYDLAPSPPELLNHQDNGFTTTQTPFFKMTAWDNDTILLLFRFEISQDNFSTIRSSYNQRVSPDNWDKPGYRPGETATYQLSPYDRLPVEGEYQWRAYVWDGTVWSPPSVAGRLRVDTKPPVARAGPLPAYTSTLKFNVSWDGSDPEPGSGLDPTASFDVQYKDRESSPWMDWQVGTNRTTAEFTGQQGKTYFFQARSRDAAGNVGAYSMGAGDARTLVDVTPPAGTVVDDGDHSSNNTRLHAAFLFNDFESEVIRYEYWIGTSPGGNETFGPAFTDRPDATVGSLFLKNGTRYYFSVRALNRAGLWSQTATADGIGVRLRQPVASLAFSGGTQAGPEIELRLDSSDPNILGIQDADLEYREASIRNRVPVDWSVWKEMGGSDWGDPVPSAEPFLFAGEPGKAYRFRYRVKDRADTYSDFAEPSNLTRIDRPPEARIVAPLAAQSGKVLAFSGNGSSDPDGDRLVYTWDFGDGRSAGGVEARHPYRKAGKFTVTLYVDDGIINSTATQLVEIRAPPAVADYTLMYTVLTALVVIAAAAGAYAAARRRRGPPAVEPGAETPEYRPEYGPAVVPGSERLPPPPPPMSAAEVEAQIAAARAEVAEIDQLGIETARTSRMLGLAQSFLAEGNLDMASQYAKKTVKLARDQRARKESEVDEPAARRFITETQQLLDGMDAPGVDLKPAKRLMGLAISFMADGNYVTGMQYSKKVRKMVDEIRVRRQSPEVSAGAVLKEIGEVEALSAGLRKAGEDASAVEEELSTARLFLEEEDLPPAMEHASKARSLARELGEREGPLTPQQWKERVAAVRARVEKGKDEGLRVAEPAKMLKFSESFALQGNLEVATQYVRKAQKLLDDMDARARVDASKPPQTRGPHLCPRCSEETEPGWAVCAYCNQSLKAPEKEVRVAKPVDDGEAGSRMPAKVATPVEDPAGKCPRCGEAVLPHWKACPSCESPLE
jgi:hypothetical protein